MKDVII